MATDAPYPGSDEIVVARHDPGHPPGAVRWGWDRIRNRPLDLPPRSFTRHVAMIGVTGSGKTTAIGRLAEGVLRLGWSVVLLDCKSGGLRQTALDLAATLDVDARIVDPVYPDTWRYNPAAGDPAAVKNKLIGSLQFGAEGEVYKQIAEEAIGLLVESLRALDRPVTLATLRTALAPESMRGLVGELSRAERVDLASEVRALTGRVAHVSRRFRHTRPRCCKAVCPLRSQVWLWPHLRRPLIRSTPPDPKSHIASRE